MRKFKRSSKLLGVYYKAEWVMQRGLYALAVESKLVSILSGSTLVDWPCLYASWSSERKCWPRRVSRILSCGLVRAPATFWTMPPD